MFRAYGTAPAETPSGADLYSWTTPIFNKGVPIDRSFNLYSRFDILAIRLFLRALSRGAILFARDAA